MLRLNKRVDYAILILTLLAREEQGPLSAGEISKQFRISRNMVSNILKDLAKGGLVRSMRGAQGGYALTRSPGEISLTHVLEALEGPFALLDCCNLVPSPRPSQGCSTTSVSCTARPVIQRLNQGVRALLDQVRVRDFEAGASAAC